MTELRRLKTMQMGGLMVVTGCINTLATKWADYQSARGSVGVYNTGEACSKNTTTANESVTFIDPPYVELEQCEYNSLANVTHVHAFNHPFLQAAGMFIGELSCLVVFKLIQSGVCVCIAKPQEGRVDFSPFLFLLPACCDLLASSMMFIGLTMTFASSFQMLRSAQMIFTGLVSLIFLGRKLKIHEWTGMVVITVGLVLVALSDTLFGEKQNTNQVLAPLEGDIIIVVAQIIVAFQIAWEEKIVKAYNVPALQAVGWEGLFGFTILTSLLALFYHIHYSVNQLSPPRLEDAIDGLQQMSNDNQILAATLLSIVSLGFYNFSGITVTKLASGVTRMVVDTLRTLFVWLFSLAISWQKFQWLQPIGFFVLVIGMVVYHLDGFHPILSSVRNNLLGEVTTNSGEQEPLLVNPSLVQGKSDKDSYP